MKSLVDVSELGGGLSNQALSAQDGSAGIEEYVGTHPFQMPDVVGRNVAAGRRATLCQRVAAGYTSNGLTVAPPAGPRERPDLPRSAPGRPSAGDSQCAGTRRHDRWSLGDTCSQLLGHGGPQFAAPRAVYGDFGEAVVDIVDHTHVGASATR